MSEQSYNGGPAFPASEGVSGYGGARPILMPGGDTQFEQMAPGMTLRDYIAIKAVAAYIGVFCNTGNETPHDDMLAGWAYRMADAMLAARKAQR